MTKERTSTSFSDSQVEFEREEKFEDAEMLMDELAITQRLELSPQEESIFLQLLALNLTKKDATLAETKSTLQMPQAKALEKLPGCNILLSLAFRMFNHQTKIQEMVYQEISEDLQSEINQVLAEAPDLKPQLDDLKATVHLLSTRYAYEKESLTEESRKGLDRILERQARKRAVQK